MSDLKLKWSIEKSENRSEKKKMDIQKKCDITIEILNAMIDAEQTLEYIGPLRWLFIEKVLIALVIEPHFSTRSNFLQKIVFVKFME